MHIRNICCTHSQGRLNSLKVVGAQLTNKTHFYCEKLNSYEHLQILWGEVPPVPPLVPPPMHIAQYCKLGQYTCVLYFFINHMIDYTALLC